MELRQLRYFLEVAAQGSVSQGARVLNIAQPAVSRQIKHLEEELNSVLFERNGSGIQLTHSGRKLQAMAKRVIDRTKQIEDEFKVCAQPRDTLRVGLPPAIAKLLLGQRHEALDRIQKHTLLRFSEAPTHRLEDWLRSDEIDCAVMTNSPSHNWLSVVPLWDEPLFLVGSTHASRPSRVPLASLDGIDMVLTSEPDPARIYLGRQLQRYRISPNIRMDVESQQASIRMCKEGVANTVLPFSAISEELRSGNVCASQIEGLSIRRVWAKKRLTATTKAQREFSSILRTTIREKYLAEINSTLIAR